VAEIGSAQAGEREGSGAIVPAAGTAGGAGAQPGALAGEGGAQGDAVPEAVVTDAVAPGDAGAQPVAGEPPAGLEGDVAQPHAHEPPAGAEDAAQPQTHEPPTGAEDVAQPQTHEPPAEAEGGVAGETDTVVVPAVAATGFMQRAVIRRRVRFLRRRRELALHDLGGFAFESHRLGQPREELLAQKLSAIGELDDELAALQDALGQHEELALLREPGISSCPQCSTIHDSAARYCPTCGRPTAGTPS
jgi:hypothetical protein